MRVRQLVVQFLEEHRVDYQDFLVVAADDLNMREEDSSELFSMYLFEMAKEKTWGGQLELHAIAQRYKYCFISLCDDLIFLFSLEIHIYEKANTIIKIEAANPNKIIKLAFSNGNHYDLIYSHDYMTKATYAQSLVYDMVSAALELPYKTPQNFKFKNIGYDDWLKKLKSKSFQDPHSFVDAFLICIHENRRRNPE